MSPAIVYQWFGAIVVHLPLKKWQGLNLAALSLGIVQARRCTISMVAEQLGGLGKADSMERRLQRFLSNRRVRLQECCQAWSGWVLSHFAGQEIILMVDETKLAERLSVMLVGLAYRRRCIPLAWRCYRPNAWPMRQVELILELLGWVAQGLPPGCVPIVQADRGLGTSPQLAREVGRRGWIYLFRVQGSTRFRHADGTISPLSACAQRGGRWSGQGWVFKKAGWIPAYVHVIWKRNHAQPWCLITNTSAVAGSAYANRPWQEESFRDLKSGGWHWNRSRVWLPEHADRLVLAMALAYAWVLSLGTQVIRSGKAGRRGFTRGRRHNYSVFRLGLRLWSQLITTAQHFKFTLFFVPHLPLFPNVS